MRPVTFAVIAVVIGCKDPPPSVDAAATTARTTTPTPTPTPTPTREAVEPPPPASDAGIASCTFLARATKLAHPGPFTIASSGGSLDVLAQDRGEPFLAGTVNLASNAITVLPSSSDGKRERPGCAAAGAFAFCVSPQGDVHRYRLTAAAKPATDSFIAHARGGSSLSAALVSGHTIVGYLRDRTTSEGPVTEAYVEGDDGTELRVSEDGAGATAVALAPHGDGAIAAYVDARRGMSPVHARTLNMNGGKLALGKDAVVFVGGSAEVFTRATLGARGPTAYILLPVAHDIAFGLGIAKIDGEAPTDAPVTWSDYPNGLDPAPIAATVGDTHATYVARVRPSAPKYGSPRVIELGEIDAASAFKPFGIVPTSGSPVDVAIASDGANGFVLAYTDAAGGWALRLKCAP